jgi:hypothetical protein
LLELKEVEITKGNPGQFFMKGSTTALAGIASPLQSGRHLHTLFLEL